MQWISVRDKLPDKLKEVLTVDANEEQAVCMLNNKKEWVYLGCYDDCCYCTANNITHWMELPEGPE